VFSESFVRVRIELAGVGVPLDGGVELTRVKCFEPRAKTRELARGKLFDGFLDVFGGGHGENIAFVRGEARRWPLGPEINHGRMQLPRAVHQVTA
jgi:hypothetical protein